MADITTLEMNLGDYDDFACLPTGEYKGTIMEVEKRIDKSGNDYYYIVWNIATDEYPADYDVANNPEGTRCVYASLKAVTQSNRRTITGMKNFFKAIGLSLKTVTIDESEWIGKEATLRLKEVEFNGAPANQIDGIEQLA